MKIRSILIANRGEIVSRIIKTCRTLGIKTIAVFSDADREAIYVKQADESVHIGNSLARESYLNIEKIISVAVERKADAIHPGYGFLSENPEFATACAKANIIFIGPSPSSMGMVGDKSAVKKLLQDVREVPLVPGYNGNDLSLSNLRAQAEKIGYPILLKASAGGGGKGMRVVNEEKELETAIASVRSEGKNSFGSEDFLMEKYFTNVRHIEIQVLGDVTGEVMYFTERDCSLQRRHQKVIEETPSPFMTSELRARMGAAAVAVAKRAKYVNAGTVEFLVDGKRNFYFLEVNTRLQVEHPITEIVHGLDLVQLQIEIAEGKSLKELGLVQKEHAAVKLHAMECRLYAEDPTKNFFPCTGKLTKFTPAHAEGVRFDSGVASGSEIGIFYDPMLAKVITFGPSRDIVMRRMIQALRQTVVLGLVTNKFFLLGLLQDSNFSAGKADTRYIDSAWPAAKRDKIQQLTPSALNELAIVGTLHKWAERRQSQKALRHVPSGFSNTPTRMQKTTLKYKQPGETAARKVVVQYHFEARSAAGARRRGGSASGVEKERFPFEIKIGEAKLNAVLVGLPDHKDNILRCEINGTSREYVVVSEGDEQIFIHSRELGDHLFHQESRFAAASADSDSADGKFSVRAPMPSKILRLLVKDGENVKKGTLVAVIESMKMEMNLFAEQPGQVKLFVKEGQIVKEQATLFVITPTSS